MEKAASRLAGVTDGPGPPGPERFATPGARTIQDLVTGFDAPADRQVKTLVYVLDDRLTLVLLRGDHSLVEQKLVDATGAVSVRPAHADEIRAALGASPGSLGAVGVTDLPVIVDEALRHRRDMFTGANTDDVHLRGVDVDRDVAPERWADLRAVAAGEPCVTCGHPLEIRRAMEVGHIFKLGHRYSEAMGVSVLTAAGDRVTPIMGSYGIGVERAMSAIVESHHDDRGIRWPMAVAPFQVAVVVAQPDDEEVATVGEQVYRELGAAGLEVIIDDRPERAGVKFRDVELVGIPLRVTVGRRGVAEGVVELTHRSSGDTERVAVGGIVTRLRDAVAAAD
jgi:prolyl-tRNA synthetase